MRIIFFSHVLKKSRFNLTISPKLLSYQKDPVETGKKNRTKKLFTTRAFLRISMKKGDTCVGSDLQCSADGVTLVCVEGHGKQKLGKKKNPLQRGTGLRDFRLS